MKWFYYCLLTVCVLALSACHTPSPYASRVVSRELSYGNRMTVLPGLDWEPMWVSYLGSIQGCLRYFSNDVSTAWLFGATGHAFIMNIHPDLCPSGPTAFDTAEMLELGRTIGFRTESVASRKNWKRFETDQRRAWELVRNAIDHGYPCIGWDLDIPEYYCIYGYDHKGYYYKGPLNETGAGPKKWRTLGDSAIGVLSVSAIIPCPAADAAQTVHDALQYALDFARSRAWLYEGYRSGIDAYDSWIAALETGAADPNGLAYNAQVWSECRANAPAFLAEAQLRLPGVCDPLFEKAIREYRSVAEQLRRVAELFPFLNTTPAQKQANMRNPVTVAAALAALRRARAAEYEGLLTLNRIVTILENKN